MYISTVYTHLIFINPAFSIASCSNPHPKKNVVYHEGDVGDDRSNTYRNLDWIKCGMNLDETILQIWKPERNCQLSVLMYLLTRFCKRSQVSTSSELQATISKKVTSVQIFFAISLQSCICPLRGQREREVCFLCFLADPCASDSRSTVRDGCNVLQPAQLRCLFVTFEDLSEHATKRATRLHR